MAKKDYSKIIDYAKLSLSRNDESIRFSESKAGLLFSFVGLIIGLSFNEISLLKPLFSIKDFLGIAAIISITLLITGTITVIISTLLIVLPRLKVTKNPSFLYFGYIQSLTEQGLLEDIKKVDSEVMLSHLTSQVHATSIILKRKYRFIRIEIFGAILVFIGWSLATTIIFYTS